MDLKNIKNLEDVKEAIAFIDSIKGDDESAHSAEDKLHQAVLHQVSLGHPQSAEMANEALKTLSMDFSRWCA